MPLDTFTKVFFVILLFVAPFGSLLSLSQTSNLMTVPKLMTLAFTVYWLWKGFTFKDARVLTTTVSNRLFLWLWFMVLAYLISFYGIHNMASGVKGWIRLLALLVFITLIADFTRDKSRFKLAVTVLLFGCLFACSLGVYEMVTKKSALSLFGQNSYLHSKTTEGETVANKKTMSLPGTSASETVVRVQGPQDDPNIHAAYMVCLVGLALAMLFTCESRLAKASIVVLIGLTALNVLEANSRSGLVGFGMTGYLFLLFAPYKNKPVVVILLVLLAIASPIIILNLQYIIPNYNSFHLVGVNQIGQDPRIMAWKMGMRAIARHPFMGIGPNNFMKLYYQYWKPGYIQTVQPIQNSFIEVWAEGGLLAFMSYIVFWVLSLYAMFKVLFTSPDRFRRVFAAGLVASFIGLLPLHFLQENIWQQEFLWMLYGLAAFVISLPADSSETAESAAGQAPPARISQG